MRTSNLMIIAMMVAVALFVACGDPEQTDEDTTIDTGLEDTAEVHGDLLEETTSDTVEPDVTTTCTSDGDCDDSDPCTADSCDTTDDACIHDSVDEDGDGFAAAMVDSVDCGGDDCDDGDDTVYPGAEVQCDGVDHDCSGGVDSDDDADGYDSILVCPETGDDCDDFDDTINPGATADCGEIDADCDGYIDCTDSGCTVACPFSRVEMDCEDEVDNDGDGDVDCADEHCVLAVCCTGIDCAAGETCCADECCDVTSDTGCCGGCDVECEDDEMCCDGECAECCLAEDCDDSNTCTLDYCTSGECVNDSSLTDMVPCAGGICCSGTCRIGGECCEDAHCGCLGFSGGCDDADSVGICNLQTGCSWVDLECRTLEEVTCVEFEAGDDFCDFRCDNCETWMDPYGGSGCSPVYGATSDMCEPNVGCASRLIQWDCDYACGCTWTGTECTGTGCHGLAPMLCSSCPICFYVEDYGYCNGIHATCASHGATDCDEQLGCVWRPTCSSHTCS